MARFPGHRVLVLLLNTLLALPSVVVGLAVYLLLLGLRILTKAFAKATKARTKHKKLGLLAAAGGFLDSFGGGGWGPVVTSNLLIQGTSPRTTVGTVNSAEFVVAVAVSITYLLSLGVADLTAPVVGLLIGGVVAAPLGSLVTRHVPPRPMMIAVGILLTIISSYSFYRAML